LNAAESGVYEVYLSASNDRAPQYGTTASARVYVGDVDLPPYFFEPPASVSADVDLPGRFEIEVRDDRVEESLDLFVTSSDGPPGLDHAPTTGPTDVDDDGDGVVDATRAIYEVHWPAGLLGGSVFHVTLSASDGDDLSAPHEVRVTTVARRPPTLIGPSVSPSPGVVGIESVFHVNTVYLGSPVEPNQEFDYTVALAGDVNGDGTIDPADVSLMTDAVGAPYDPWFDVDADGEITGADVDYVLAHVGQVFPAGFEPLSDDGMPDESGAGYTWTPTLSDIGDHEFMFQVTDSHGLSDANLFHYTVGGPPYGDIVDQRLACWPNGVVDLADILAILDAFQNVFGENCELADADLAPCDGDGVIGLNDVLAVLDGFAGLDNCPSDAP